MKTLTSKRLLLKIMQIIKKVEYYFKIPHFHFLQATFSFLREKPVSQQKLLTVTLVNLNKLLTVTLVNFDSYSPL